MKSHRNLFNINTENFFELGKMDEIETFLQSLDPNHTEASITVDLLDNLQNYLIFHSDFQLSTSHQKLIDFFSNWITKFLEKYKSNKSTSEDINICAKILETLRVCRVSFNFPLMEKIFLLLPSSIPKLRIPAFVFLTDRATNDYKYTELIFKIIKWTASYFDSIVSEISQIDVDLVFVIIHSFKSYVDFPRKITFGERSSSTYLEPLTVSLFNLICKMKDAYISSNTTLKPKIELILIKGIHLLGLILDYFTKMKIEVEIAKNLPTQLTENCIKLSSSIFTALPHSIHLFQNCLLLKIYVLNFNSRISNLFSNNAMLRKQMNDLSTLILDNLSILIFPPFHSSKKISIFLRFIDDYLNRIDNVSSDLIVPKIWPMIGNNHIHSNTINRGGSILQTLSRNKILKDENKLIISSLQSLLSCFYILHDLFIFQKESIDLDQWIEANTQVLKLFYVMTRTYTGEKKEPLFINIFSLVLKHTSFIINLYSYIYNRLSFKEFRDKVVTILMVIPKICFLLPPFSLELVLSKSMIYLIKSKPPQMYQYIHKSLLKILPNFYPYYKAFFQTFLNHFDELFTGNASATSSYIELLSDVFTNCFFSSEKKPQTPDARYEDEICEVSNQFMLKCLTSNYSQIIDFLVQMFYLFRKFILEPKEQIASNQVSGQMRFLEPKEQITSNQVSAQMRLIKCFTDKIKAHSHIYSNALQAANNKTTIEASISVISLILFPFIFKIPNEKRDWPKYYEQWTNLFLPALENEQYVLKSLYFLNQNLNIIKNIIKDISTWIADLPKKTQTRFISALVCSFTKINRKEIDNSRRLLSKIPGLAVDVAIHYVDPVVKQYQATLGGVKVYVQPIFDIIRRYEIKRGDFQVLIRLCFSMISKMSILEAVSCNLLYEIFNFIFNKDRNTLINEFTTFTNDLLAYLTNKEPSASYENEKNLQKDESYILYEDRLMDQYHSSKNNLSKNNSSKTTSSKNNSSRKNENNEDVKNDNGQSFNKSDDISKIREHNTDDLKLDFDLNEIHDEFKYSVILFAQKYAKNVNLNEFFQNDEEINKMIELLVPLCVIKPCVGTVLHLLEFILEKLPFSQNFYQISIGLLHASVYKYKHVKKLFRKYFFNSAIYQDNEVNQKIAREKISHQFYHCATDIHLPIRHISIEGILFYQKYLNIQDFSESTFRTVLQSLVDPSLQKFPQNLHNYSYYEYVFVLNLEEFDLKDPSLVTKFLDMIPPILLTKPVNINSKLFKNSLQSERDIKFILKIVAKLLPAIPDNNSENIFQHLFATLRNEKLKGFIDYFLKHANRNTLPIKFSPEFQKTFVRTSDSLWGFQRADEIKLIRFWLSVVQKNGYFKIEEIFTLLINLLKYVEEQGKMSLEIFPEMCLYTAQIFGLATQLLSFKQVDKFKLVASLVKVYVIISPKFSISILGSMKTLAETAPLELLQVFQQNCLKANFNSDEIFLSLKLFVKVPTYRKTFLQTLNSQNMKSTPGSNTPKLTNPNNINANNSEINATNDNLKQLFISYIKRLHFNQSTLVHSLLFDAFVRVLNNKNDEKKTKHYGFRMELEQNLKTKNKNKKYYYPKEQDRNIYEEELKKEKERYESFIVSDEEFVLMLKIVKETLDSFDFSIYQSSTFLGLTTILLHPKYCDKVDYDVFFPYFLKFTNLFNHPLFYIKFQQLPNDIQLKIVTLIQNFYNSSNCSDIQSIFILNLLSHSTCLNITPPPLTINSSKNFFLNLIRYDIHSTYLLKYLKQQEENNDNSKTTQNSRKRKTKKNHQEEQQLIDDDHFEELNNLVRYQSYNVDAFLKKLASDIDDSSILTLTRCVHLMKILPDSTPYLHDQFQTLFSSTSFILPSMHSLFLSFSSMYEHIDFHNENVQRLIILLAGEFTNKFTHEDNFPNDFSYASSVAHVIQFLPPDGAPFGIPYRSRIIEVLLILINSILRPKKEQVPIPRYLLLDIFKFFTFGNDDCITPYGNYIIHGDKEFQRKKKLEKLAINKSLIDKLRIILNTQQVVPITPNQPEQPGPHQVQNQAVQYQAQNQPVPHQSTNQLSQTRLKFIFQVIIATAPLLFADQPDFVPNELLPTYLKSNSFGRDMDIYSQAIAAINAAGGKEFINQVLTTIQKDKEKDYQKEHATLAKTIGQNSRNTQKNLEQSVKVFQTGISSIPFVTFSTWLTELEKDVRNSKEITFYYLILKGLRPLYLNDFMETIDQLPIPFHPKVVEILIFLGNSNRLFKEVLLKNPKTFLFYSSSPKLISAFSKIFVHNIDSQNDKISLDGNNSKANDDENNDRSNDNDENDNDENNNDENDNDENNDNDNNGDNNNDNDEKDYKAMSTQEIQSIIIQKISKLCWETDWYSISPLNHAQLFLKYSLPPQIGNIIWRYEEGALALLPLLVDRPELNHFFEYYMTIFPQTRLSQNLWSNPQFSAKLPQCSKSEYSTFKFFNLLNLCDTSLGFMAAKHPEFRDAILLNQLSQYESARSYYMDTMAIQRPHPNYHYCFPNSSEDNLNDENEEIKTYGEIRKSRFVLNKYGSDTYIPTEAELKCDPNLYFIGLIMLRNVELNQNIPFAAFNSIFSVVRTQPFFTLPFLDNYNYIAKDPPFTTFSSPVYLPYLILNQWNYRDNDPKNFLRASLELLQLRNDANVPAFDDHIKMLGFPSLWIRALDKHMANSSLFTWKFTFLSYFQGDTGKMQSASLPKRQALVQEMIKKNKFSLVGLLSKSGAYLRAYRFLKGIKDADKNNPNLYKNPKEFFKIAQYPKIISVTPENIPLILQYIDFKFDRQTNYNATALHRCAVLLHDFSFMNDYVSISEKKISTDIDRNDQAIKTWIMAIIEIMENWSSLIQVSTLYKILANYISFSRNSKGDLLYAIAINALKITNDKEQFANLFINGIREEVRIQCLKWMTKILPSIIDNADIIKFLYRKSPPHFSLLLRHCYYTGVIDEQKYNKYNMSIKASKEGKQINDFFSFLHNEDQKISPQVNNIPSYVQYYRETISSIIHHSLSQEEIDKIYSENEGDILKYNFFSKDNSNEWQRVYCSEIGIKLPTLSYSAISIDFSRDGKLKLLLSNGVKKEFYLTISDFLPFSYDEQIFIVATNTFIDSYPSTKTRIRYQFYPPTFRIDPHLNFVLGSNIVTFNPSLSSLLKSYQSYNYNQNQNKKTKTRTANKSKNENEDDNTDDIIEPIRIRDLRKNHAEIDLLGKLLKESGGNRINFLFLRTALAGSIGVSYALRFLFNTKIENHVSHLVILEGFRSISPGFLNSFSNEDDVNGFNMNFPMVPLTESIRKVLPDFEIFGPFSESWQSTIESLYHHRQKVNIILKALDLGTEKMVENRLKEMSLVVNDVIGKTETLYPRKVLEHLIENSQNCFTLMPEMLTWI